MFSVEYFADAAGTVIVDEWLDHLVDKQAAARITTRIERLKRGAFGDCKPLQDGVWELRVDYGPGYRVYYSVVGKKLVLLLCGGDKRRQGADIERAIYYLNDYRRRKR